mmetsp:Transcript_6821/g.10527  ORF Transcript_6821/g.10527 Transcript_6821/m.10527 type:complete len:407 (-) Transcript_6821:86-1306(-)
MCSVTLQNQEDALAAFASSMSTALTANNLGKLTVHEGCRKTSETSLERITLSPTLTPNQSFCAVPSLSLRKRGHRSSTSTKAAVEQAATSNLAEPLKASQNDVQLLPSRLVNNVSESFMSLVDSRFRSYLTVLAHQSRKDPNTFAPLLRVFSAMSRPVSISTIVNKFRVLEHSTRTIQENRIVSSLTLETMIDLNILGDSLTVVVAGSGVVHGVFDPSSSVENALSSATIMVDTHNLLQSMVVQARHAVKVAKDRISQLYLLSLSQTNATGDSSTRHGHADETASRLPLNLNPDISAGQGATQSLPDASVSNNIHAMSPPPRRLSANSVPIQARDNEKASKARLGGNETKESIHSPKSSGLDLLTRAAKCLKVPSGRVLPDSKKGDASTNESDTCDWSRHPDVAEV